MDDGDKLTSITQGGTTVKSYGYDAAGRTTSVASSAGTTTLGYDYEGRVASISGPGVSNTFTYNGLDTRVGKVDSAGTSTYRRDGAEVTAPVLSDGGAVYTPGVSQRRSGSTTYDLSDRLGTAAKQTNASASTTATRTYDAFGMLLASTGTPQGPFGFAATSGYQEDGDSGLKLLGHRYYDPSTGRFLSRDPAEDGRNWYVYCAGNPLGSVDPLGLRAWYGGIGLHGIAVLISVSVHIDIYYDPDGGGFGVGISGGAGPGAGWYAGAGFEGGYDGSANVNTGSTSNWATGVATPIASAEVLDNHDSWLIPPTTTGQVSGAGGGVGIGAIGGVYRERRVTAMLRFL